MNWKTNVDSGFVLERISCIDEADDDDNDADDGGNDDA